MPTSILDLSSDIIFLILSLSPRASTLHSLILTHPNFYDAFTSRRRLILRTVYRPHVGAPTVGIAVSQIRKANASIPTTSFTHPIDKVALLEGVWASIARLVKTGTTSQSVAKNLVDAYRELGMLDEAVAFSEQLLETLRTKTSGAWAITPEMQVLQRSIVRVYLDLDMGPKAIRLQKDIRNRIPRNRPEHNAMSKDILATYRSLGDDAAVLSFCLECWNTCNSRDSAVALEWARLVVLEYQASGQKEEALRFHAESRKILDRTGADYVAWSRQLVRLYEREQRPLDALAVTEEVFQQLGPSSKGYRPWASQLCAQYEALGRRDDAVLIAEAVWSAFLNLLDGPRGYSQWGYHVVGAGLALSKLYARNGRSDMAATVEAMVRDLDPRKETT